MDYYPLARQIECAFYDQRPDPADISLLVIHNISLPPGEFGGSDIRALFTGSLDTHAHPFYQQLEGVRVSAHCVVFRDGRVEQFVPFSERAWHAGYSSFQGRPKCNDFAIGIELEGTDVDNYTDKQYQSLCELTQFIQRSYPKISLGRIVGHCDIAPGRKTDPGPVFDWCRFRQAVTTNKKE